MKKLIKIRHPEVRSEPFAIGSNRYRADHNGEAIVEPADSEVLVVHCGWLKIGEVSGAQVSRPVLPQSQSEWLQMFQKSGVTSDDLRTMALQIDQLNAGHVPAPAAADVPQPPPEAPEAADAPEFKVMDWVGPTDEAEAALVADDLLEEAKAKAEEEAAPKTAGDGETEEVSLSMETPFGEVKKVAKAMGLKVKRTTKKAQLLEDIQAAAAV